MQGILLIDKPAGWTSFDVVNYVRKIVATAEEKKPKHVKVGHSGTLDPFATGLLILLIGKEYTRRASEFSKLDKTYEVTMKLGETSTTGDPEGEITVYRLTDVRHSERSEESQTSRSFDDTQDDSGTLRPSQEELEAAVAKFRGSIEQIPPAYSAIKVNGQRAYKLAREGKEVVIEPRKVTVNRLQVTDYHYPEVKLVADVSSGTYIRTLVEDIGKTLGTGAYSTQLRRTNIADFSVEQAVQVKELSEKELKERMIDKTIES